MNNEYRQELLDYGSCLLQDWRKWTVLQIKDAMLHGKKSMHIFDMKNGEWKKAKNFFNFWKKVPDSELKYYHTETNVLIIDENLRKCIDFILDLGLEWFPYASQPFETVTLKYNQIHCTLKYQ
jgi:hypothetical protein